MISICYTADSGYAMQVAVSMISMLENNKQNELEFYVLGDGFSKKIENNFQIIEERYGVRIVLMDVSEKMKVFNNTALSKESGIMHNGLISFMFARLFIGSCLPQDIDKVIYIDCDTLYVGDIRELYETPIDNNCIFSAVRDLWPMSYNKAIGLSEDEVYFQSGIMLVDLKKWREFRCEETILNAAKKSKRYYFMHDQDLLNICFHGMIDTLSPKYGMIYILREYSAEECLWLSGRDVDHYYSVEDINKAKNDIHVIHYAGDYFGRPWSFPKSCHDNRIWLAYYKKTPWALEPVGNKHSIFEWTKFIIKWLTYPFTKKAWLKRTKNRFEDSNSRMIKEMADKQ